MEAGPALPRVGKQCRNASGCTHREDLVLERPGLDLGSKSQRSSRAAARGGRLPRRPGMQTRRDTSHPACDGLAPSDVSLWHLPGREHHSAPRGEEPVRH